jgi:hypothetical protein
VGAQQVRAAARPGGFQRPREGSDPGHRRRRVRSGQARPGQRRGPVIIGIQADPCPPLRRLAPVLRALRVGDDDRAAEPGPELGVGELARTGQHVVLDAAGGVFLQQAGGLGDQPRPVGVDLPGGQRSAGGRQPPGQRDGLARPPLGGAGGQGQGQADLRRSIRGDGGGPAVFLQAGLVVAGGGADSDLGDGGELAGLCEGGDAAPPGGDGGQVIVTGVGGVALVQPGGQARAARACLIECVKGGL